ACMATTPRCDEGSCYLCANGDKKCGDDGLPYLCQNHAWQRQSACPSDTPACEAGSCFLCKNGSRSCSADSSVPRRCVAHAWAPEEACRAGTEYCLNGNCTSCPAGHANCDGHSDNACEVDLSQPPNCGRCGNAGHPCYQDTDGDGYGKDAVAMMACGTA